MNPSVRKAEPKQGYKLIVHFSNDEVREFDVSPYLDKGIFAELRDDEYFKKVRVEFGAVEWPNQQDFSKDTLYLNSTPVGT